MCSSTGTGGAGAPAFVGRSADLRALTTAVAAAVGGRGCVALVAGEPGMGKTSLVAEVASRVDATVCWSFCRPSDAASAFRLWSTVIRRVRRDVLADAPPELAETAASAAWLLDGAGSEAEATGPGVGLDERLAAFDAVEALLHAAADRTPLVVIVEDLHWADEASVRLLEHLARGVTDSHLAVIGTYRDVDVGEGHPLVGALDHLAAAGPHITLRGLAPDELGALVDGLGGAPMAVDELLRRTGGNPLFCRELVRLLAVDHEPVVPAGIRAVIERRLARLRPLTRRVLRAAAVWGGEVDLRALASTVDVPRDEVTAALDEAAAARLVVLERGGRRAQLVHALVGEVLADELSTSERTDVHRRVARTIEETGDPDRVDEAAHHALAGAAGDDVAWAVDLAARAAARAMTVLAYEEAAAWCERALAALRSEAPADVAEVPLLLTLGEARLASGDVEDARAAYERVATIARRTGDASLLADAALGFGLGFGAIEVQWLDPAQVDLLEEALAALGPEPTERRVWVLARLSVALSFMDQEERRTVLAEEAVATARHLDDRRALGHALVARCHAHSGPDHCEERAADAAEVVAAGVAAGDVRLEALGRRLRVVALLELGRVAGADVEITAFGRIAERLRQPRYQWYLPLWRGARALMRGDVEEAERLHGEAARLAERAASPAGWLHTYTLWWMIRRVAGQADEAGRTMTELLQEVGHSPLALTDRWAVAAAMSGERDRATTLLDQWLHDGVDRRVRDSEWLPEAAQVAEAAVVCGHRELAAVMLERLAPYERLICVEGPGAACTGSVAWYLAMLADFLDRPDEAAAYRAVATEMHGRVGLVGDPPPLTATPVARTGGQAPSARRFVHEGATWEIAFDARVVRVRDTKGMADLAVLLARPGLEVPALELMGGADVGGAAGPAIDAAARQAYEARIRDLQDDVEEARAMADLGRAERAEAELDTLVTHLAGAVGLGGRDRTTGSAVERARSAVTQRIRAAIRAITDADPDAGAHLQRSVRTGIACAYTPDPPVTWHVEP